VLRDILLIILEGEFICSSYFNWLSGKKEMRKGKYYAAKTVEEVNTYLNPPCLLYVTL